jgi:hypothetical protein
MIWLEKNEVRWLIAFRFLPACRMTYDSKKSQLKKVVREMPVADGNSSSPDPWAWRKYGQKPIKGSPYPR